MPIENLPSNSDHPVDKSSEEERSITPLTLESAVTQRKKSVGGRIKESIFGASDAKDVAGYLIQDVIIPGTKDLISDLVVQGIERALFGTSSGRSRGRSSRESYSNTRTSYRNVGNNNSDRNSRRRDDERYNRNRAMHNFDDIIIEDRAEAERTLAALDDYIDRYTTASVSDLYQLVGISGSFTDDKYGWSNLSSARVTRVRGGYLLDLPRPVLLD